MIQSLKAAGGYLALMSATAAIGDLEKMVPRVRWGIGQDRKLQADNSVHVCLTALEENVNRDVYEVRYPAMISHVFSFSSS